MRARSREPLVPNRTLSSSTAFCPRRQGGCLAVNALERMSSYIRPSTCGLQSSSAESPHPCHRPSTAPHVSNYLFSISRVTKFIFTLGRMQTRLNGNGWLQSSIEHDNRRRRWRLSKSSYRNSSIGKSISFSKIDITVFSWETRESNCLYTGNPQKTLMLYKKRKIINGSQCWQGE